ncbi:MAG: polyprenol phosphomannose-dependent alpha 1,6 mannosyltransferase MptB [Propionibacteriaceae bacterium]|nr:polyprenol phosphomannose-dependent alpha 1,6 mannosyltransferase MptB [Propionibacteriaceae bacterium]
MSPQAIVASLREAAHTPAVWWGFLGTVCLTIGSFSPGYLPITATPHRWLESIGIDGVVVKLLGTALLVAGLLLLAAAWLMLRPRENPNPDKPTPAAAAVLTIWCIPLLFAAPLFSTDAYSYAAQGWLWHNDINPYDVGPGTLPGAFADNVAWVWRWTRAPYGPLAIEINYWLVVICRFHPALTAWAMRLPALVGVVLLAYCLPRIARHRGLDARLVSWFGVLNPLVLVNFVGGCHNDALMVGLMVGGLWLAGRRTQRFAWCWWLLGAVVVGLAAAVKQPAVLAAVALPFLARPIQHWTPRAVAVGAARTLVSLAIASGVFALVSMATGLGFGWVFAVDVPGRIVTVAPFTLLGKLLAWLANAFDAEQLAATAVFWSRTFGLILAGAAIVVLAWRRLPRNPYVFVCYGLLWFVFCSPALHPWYVQWGGTLLPLAVRRIGMRLSVWATLTVLGFHAVLAAWRNSALPLGIAACFGLLVVVLRGYEAQLTQERPLPLSPAWERAPADPDARAVTE